MTRQAPTETVETPPFYDVEQRRTLVISGLAIAVGVGAIGIAQLLISAIRLVTNIMFYGNFSIVNNSPADNHLGGWVIVMPVIGGMIVGLMARYGSGAIRGHGIPEAMEQILTNESKISPKITVLKPLSAAIAIGSGGPFGAEGPIIATGGALGSLVGQVLHTTPDDGRHFLQRVPRQEWQRSSERQWQRSYSQSSCCCSNTVLAHSFRLRSHLRPRRVFVWCSKVRRACSRCRR